MSYPYGTLLTWLAPLQYFLQEVDRVNAKRTSAACLAVREQCTSSDIKVEKQEDATKLFQLIDSTVSALRRDPDTQDIAEEIDGKINQARFNNFRSTLDKEVLELRCLAGAVTEFYRGETDQVVTRCKNAGAPLPDWLENWFKADLSILNEHLAEAEPIERMMFYRDLMFGAVMLRNYSPDISSNPKVRLISSGSLLDDLPTAANDALFSKQRLMDFVETLPLTIENDAYSLTDDGFKEAKALITSAAAAPPNKLACADLVAKTYLGIMGLIATFSEFDNQTLTTLKMKRLLTTANGQTPLTTVQAAQTVEGVVEAFEEIIQDTNHRFSKAASAALSNTPAGLEQVANFFGIAVNLYSLAQSKSNADLIKNSLSAANDVAGLLALSYDKLPGSLSKVLGSSSRAASVAVGSKIVGATLGLVLAGFEIHAAKQGIGKATIANDISVAIGHILLGLSAGASALFNAALLGYFLWTGTALMGAGPAGIFIAALIGIALLGMYLVNFTADDPLSSIAQNTIFGLAPAQGTNAEDIHYEFGTSGAASHYSTADIENQILAFRSGRAPLQFAFNEGMIPSAFNTSISHTMKARANRVSEKHPALEDYANWFIEVNVIKANSSARVPMPNYHRSTAADQLLSGALTLAERNRTLAQINADTAAGDFMQAVPTDYDFLEFKFQSPADASGNRQTMFRQYVKYSS